MIKFCVIFVILVTAQQQQQRQRHRTIVKNITIESKHLKGRSVATVGNGFASQRILSFSFFLTLSVFSDPSDVFKVVCCPLLVTVLRHKGFCRFSVSKQIRNKFKK